MARLKPCPFKTHSTLKAHGSRERPLFWLRLYCARGRRSLRGTLRRPRAFMIVVVIVRRNGEWLRAQVAYDTEVAHARLDAELERITPWSGNAA